MLQSNIQCAAKKYPLKFFCHFLCSRSKFFTWNFTHLLIIHDHIKFAKQHCITFNYDKVIKFLGWPRGHFWHSRNVCRMKCASYFVMWHKMSVMKIWAKIDPHYLWRRCSPVVLDSGNIRFMRIFAGVPWRGVSNSSGIIENVDFRGLRKWGQCYYIVLFSPLSRFH